MSGIVALLALDGRPVAPRDLEALCAAAPYRGPDGSGVWTSGAAGLAHLAFHTTPDAGTQPQPLETDGGAVAITFDGRIDNRQALASRLSVAAAGASDAALALEAYRRWGTGAPAEILGDFAFVVWDSRQRTLFCARDALGIRPFYYHRSSRLFVCASDLGQILAVPGVDAAPNEGMIAEYLSNTIRSHLDTVYSGIQRLPAAHALQLTEDGTVRVRRYWAMDTSRHLRYGSDDEYAEHFRELFRDATCARLRSNHPVGVYFSGGTDSSAVAAMACQVAGSPGPPCLFTFAIDDPEADETAYVRDAAAFWNAPSRITRAVDPSRLVPPPACRDVHDCLRDRAWFEWKQSIAASGVHVMLTGQGGDYGFYGSQYGWADLLRRGRLLALWRQCRAAAADADLRWSPKDLVKYAVWPLMPAPVRWALRPVARRIAGVTPVPPWIDSRLAARIDLRGRLEPPAFPRGPSAATDDVRAEYESGWTSVYLETSERDSAEAGLEDRHPLFDRRVVEFALALPEDQRWRGDLTRFVVRRAMSGCLPESIRRRRTRGSGSARVVRAIEALGGGSLFADLAIARAGWVRQDAVDAMYRRLRDRFARGNPAYNDDAFPLWIIGGVELWFTARFGKRL